MPKKNVRNITLSFSQVAFSYGDTFKLALTGRTPKGGMMTVNVTMAFEEWPFVQSHLAEAYKKRRSQLVASLQSMDSAFSFKPTP